MDNEEVLKAQLEVMVAERDDLKADRDNLLKVLTTVQRQMEVLTGMYQKIKSAVAGGY